MAQLDIKRIVDLVGLSVDKYAEASGMGAWDTPESWMQCALLEPLREHGFFVMLECRTRDLLKWAEDGEHKPSAKFEEYSGRSGRVDVVLFEPNPVPENAKFCALIEVKKHSGVRYHCNDDASRLRDLGRRIGVEHAILVVFVQGYNETHRIQQIDELAEQLCAAPVAQSKPVDSFGSSYNVVAFNCV